MSHPDPLYDDFDAQAERNIYPWCDDESHDCDHDGWYDECEDGDEQNEMEDDLYNEDMDGDFDSAMRDAGFGTDEDYGCFGGEDY